MKKWLPCLALFLLVFVTASCQKPEAVTLSKYFDAIKAKDNNTAAAMALEPVALEFKSWKLLSVDEPVVENFAMPEMAKSMDELKKAKDEQLRLVQDKKYEFDTLQSEMNDARGKKKAELQPKVKTAEESVKAESDKFTKLQADTTKKKNEMETEKKLVTLSTDLEQGLDAYEGKTITTKAHVSINTGGSDKEYIFVLRRYDLTNPTTKKPFHNKYVILKIGTKEELEK